MKENKSIRQDKHVCKNCETEFRGNFCPECGQSIKEFERPFRFLIIDLTGNIFAFDTRFWKTFIAILFKPGTLTLDYVKGHRVRYMPPFRFYVFISFIFFLLLNYYSSEKSKLAPGKESNLTIFGNIQEDSTINLPDSTMYLSDSLDLSIELKTKPKAKPEPEETDEETAKMKFLNDHPEIFLEQLLTNLSWAMFFLMPLYGFLLWLFYRKSQKYFITHFIMAINQHAFMFVVLFIVLVLAVLLPDFSAAFRNYLVLLIPVYFVIGQKVLYQQKIWKIILKLFATGLIYSLVIFAVAIALIVLVAVQNGISIW